MTCHPRAAGGTASPGSSPSSLAGSSHICPLAFSSNAVERLHLGVPARALPRACDNPPQNSGRAHAHRVLLNCHFPQPTTPHPAALLRLPWHYHLPTILCTGHVQYVWSLIHRETDLPPHPVLSSSVSHQCFYCISLHC